MRHILALSGGKDSTALAIHMQGTAPDLPMEYCFADTGRELPDLYRFLNDLEVYLGEKIHRLTDYGRTFDYYLERWGWFLPGNASRWCTKHLKIRPFERFVGEKVNGRFKRDATIYIGLRADESEREGNYGIAGVTYAYPLRDGGITREGVEGILRGTGLRLPDFYRWRSTGGCWMCPWQRTKDWKGLKDHHPKLFTQATYEETKASETSTMNNACWSVSRKPLAQIIERYERQPSLYQVYEPEEEYDTRPCLICAK
jgi:3'-phosphoadenosine 5'-phosphosulfate sulfotransferase (PAPS reductase)/FAD synthetase